MHNLILTACRCSNRREPHWNSERVLSSAQKISATGSIKTQGSLIYINENHYLTGWPRIMTYYLYNVLILFCSLYIYIYTSVPPLQNKAEEGKWNGCCPCMKGNNSSSRGTYRGSHIAFFTILHQSFVSCPVIADITNISDTEGEVYHTSHCNSSNLQQNLLKNILNNLLSLMIHTYIHRHTPTHARTHRITYAFSFTASFLLWNSMDSCLSFT